MGAKRLPQTQSELEAWIQRFAGVYDSPIGHVRRIRTARRAFSIDWRSLRRFTEQKYPGTPVKTKEIAEFAYLALEHFAFDEMASQPAVEGFYTEYSERRDPDVLRVFADFLEESGSDRAPELRSLVDALPELSDPVPSSRRQRSRR